VFGATQSPKSVLKSLAGKDGQRLGAILGAIDPIQPHPKGWKGHIQSEKVDGALFHLKDVKPWIGYTGWARVK
jgi:hypothetical protein